MVVSTSSRRARPIGRRFRRLSRNPADVSRNSALALLVAGAVAIAFADSSIVVLALPQLYVQLHTTIEGVAWVVTAYNAAVAVVALGLVLFVHRLNATRLLVAGLLVFMAASIACSLAD